MDYSDKDFSGNWEFLPKVGEEATFDIVVIKKVVSTDDKYNFKKRVPVLNENKSQMVDNDGEPIWKDKSLGYAVECSLADGKTLKITSFFAFLEVLKKHNVQDGETIRVQHIAKGEWSVEKLGAPTEAGSADEIPEPVRGDNPPF